MSLKITYQGDKQIVKRFRTIKRKEPKTIHFALFMLILTIVAFYTGISYK